jgi:Protein of unknown function (DUF3592)
VCLRLPCICACVASLRWPITAGHITETEIVKEVTTRDRDDDDRRDRETIEYRPEIRYGYQVNGSDYSATNWKWGMTECYSDRADAEAALAKFPNGQIVTVHYDPDNPSNAVLEPEARQGTVAPLVVAVLMTGAGSLFFWMFTQLEWHRATEHFYQ